MKRLHVLLIALIASSIITTSAMGVSFADESLLPHEGIVGQEFSLQLKAINGSGPCTYKVDSGQLAHGLLMSKEGSISGTPTDTGTFQCWVSVVDSAKGHSERLLTFTIKLPPQPQPLAEDAPGAPGREKWHKPGWELTFHDEFDGTSVDRSKWSWRYTVIPSLCVLRDGIGHLRLERDFPPRLHAKGARISGLESRRTPKVFAQQYGWFELRARCYKGSGSQSAFWLTPVDGRYMRLSAVGGTRKSAQDACEIDIFEQQGNDPYGNNFNIGYGDGGDESGMMPRHVVFPFDLTADFHVYACEWNEKRVTWYVDGKEVHRSNKVPHNPFFIRLGIYEGDDPWRGNVDPKAPYPKDFDLDYVRVYRRAAQD